MRLGKINGLAYAIGFQIHVIEKEGEGLPSLHDNLRIEDGKFTYDQELWIGAENSTIVCKEV